MRQRIDSGTVTKRIIRTVVIASFGLVALGFACAPGSQAEPGQAGDERIKDERIKIVATTNIIADWVRQVGREHVDVFSLLPAGADPHTFVAGPKDVTRVSDADVVFAIGLELEPDRMMDLVDAALTDPDRLVKIGPAVTPLPFDEINGSHEEGLAERLMELVHELEEGRFSAAEAFTEMEEVLGNDDHTGEHEEADSEEAEELAAGVLELILAFEDGTVGAGETLKAIEEMAGGRGAEHEEGEADDDAHGHGELDPHVWFDPLRVKIAVDTIAEQLALIDARNAPVYEANLAAYQAELNELHAWVGEQVALIPAERRVLVTSHDSFQYFARLYGFRLVGVVLSGGSTEEELSAQALGELVEAVRDNAVPAVFAETTIRDRVVRSIADEAGVNVVQTLYTGSLGPANSGADTYLAMMRADVLAIVEALR